MVLNIGLEILNYIIYKDKFFVKLVKVFWIKCFCLYYNN